MADIRKINVGGTEYLIVDETTINTICNNVENSSTASKTYNAGEFILRNNILYEVTATIAQGATFNEGVNIDETDVTEVLTQIKSSVSDIETDLSKKPIAISLTASTNVTNLVSHGTYDATRKIAYIDVSFELTATKMITHTLPNTIPSTGRNAFLMYQPVQGGEPWNAQIDGNNIKAPGNMTSGKYRLNGWITFD